MIALSLAGSLAAGCAESSASSPPQTIESLEFENAYRHDGSSWSIECYGPMTPVVAKTGDTLLRLVLNNTDIHSSSMLGRPGLPQELVVRAVAEVNELQDENLIVAGETYEMPSYCE